MNQEQIEKLLIELYQEWYDEINPVKRDPDTVRYAKGPSFKTIKQIFKTWVDKIKENQEALNKVRNWFENHQDILREKICPKWNDQSGKSHIAILFHLWGSAAQSSDDTQKPARYQRPSRFTTTLCRTTHLWNKSDTMANQKRFGVKE
jgi:hypothetical protein